MIARKKNTCCTIFAQFFEHFKSKKIVAKRKLFNILEFMNIYSLTAFYTRLKIWYDADTSYAHNIYFKGGDNAMIQSRGSEWNRWDLHLHTKSSYDYQYKAEDADDLLCDTLKRNNIKAVAITDHFKIDAKRISTLRAKAPDIVFFPGVELRTDKGSDNLHVILIFSNELNVETLSSAFDVIMKNSAKAKDNDQTIYWTFEDIVKFAKDHDALISIHAGRKTNGIDKEISNALPVKQAIKQDIATCINFFEIGQIRDQADYEKHVFNFIERKPLIICSDCHDPNKYQPKDFLWIKGELTFEGLKQCVYQPQERVFIGTIPPMLDRLNKNKQSNISSISVKQVENPSNNMAHWFNFSIPLNNGMVAIIGNKGSGKSALSDIIAHICRSRTMHYASFLNNERFRKPPKNFSSDYIGTLIWADDQSIDRRLDDANYGTISEDAQYLPQQYIEAICNDLDDNFRDEINNLIFSYITPEVRGDTSNLEELIEQKTRKLTSQLQFLLSELHNQNTIIIQLEHKKTNSYKTHVCDSLKKLEETLFRHEKARPKEIKKPTSTGIDAKYQNQLDKLNDSIEQVRKEILQANNENLQFTNILGSASILLEKIDSLKLQFNELRKLWIEFANQYAIQDADSPFELQLPENYLVELITKAKQAKEDLHVRVHDSTTGLLTSIKNLENSKNELISSADKDEKVYQQYLKDLHEWEQKKLEILGEKTIVGTLEYYKNELEYLNNNLEFDYTKALKKRQELVKKIYTTKATYVKIYQDLYDPVQREIIKLLGNLESSISFQAEIFIKNKNLAQDILKFINQRFNGKYGRGTNAIDQIESLILHTDFNDIDRVLEFMQTIISTATENLETKPKRILNCQEFYDFIYGLSYMDVTFKLKMGKQNLNELSAGERGLVLLIFYLSLSQEKKPIIIDQPEDNLDNQSVYKKLVPCLCLAKQQRQVIIVTHNPNIAVACDAEQIIYCEMDKTTYQIKYESGAIENPKIRKHVIDVLEGTMPAFDLRRKKYE